MGHWNVKYSNCSQFVTWILDSVLRVDLHLSFLYLHFVFLCYICLKCSEFLSVISYISDGPSAPQILVMLFCGNCGCWCDFSFHHFFHHLSQCNCCPLYSLHHSHEPTVAPMRTNEPIRPGRCKTVERMWVVNFLSHPITDLQAFTYQESLYGQKSKFGLLWNYYYNQKLSQLFIF